MIYSDQETKEKIANDPKYVHLKKHLDNMAEYITSSNRPYGIHRPRKKYYFEKSKIIMPSMFADNNFVIDYDMHLYVGMSFSCIIVEEKDFLPEYVLAILNSKIAREWFYTFGKKEERVLILEYKRLEHFLLSNVRGKNKSIYQEKLN